MALSEITKITGPGIHTLSNVLSHNIKSSGIITATKFVGPIEGSITATDATFSGNVSIAGTLTYEDVTNIDSVGIITAPAVDVDDFLDVGSNIKLGNAGVITATSFVGSGAALTGIDATAIKDSGGNVKIQAQASGAIHSGVSTFQDLDVDGHTNLDNVSVAGVTTFSDDVYFDGATAGRDIIFDRSANTLQVKPNAILQIGDGATDTEIKNNGTNTQITHSPTTAFYVSANTFQVFGSGNRSGNVYDNTLLRLHNGVAELGHEIPNGGASGFKLATSVKGITVGTGVTIETNGQANFAGIVTFSHTGANQLVIKDSDTSGDAAHMRISFQDSGGTEKFFVGNNNSNGWLYLGSPSGQNNNIAFRVNGSDKFQVNAAGAYVNGDLTVNGTVDILDSIIHTGDTNTKIRFPAADTITAETAGTERLRITSDGEVKIMNTSGTVGLYFQSSSGAVSNFRAIGTNNQSLGYFFGNTEKVRFASNGNVNIGTGELDQTDRMLNVYGGRARISGITAGNSFEIYASNTSGQSYGILCQAGTNSSDINTALRNTSGVSLFRVRGDGVVFVGSSTVQQGSTSKLEVMGTLNNSYPGYSYPIMVSDDAAYNSSAGPGGGIGFSFKQNSGGAYAQAGGIRGIKENTTDGNYASALTFYTRANGAGTVEQARIDSSGFMGVKTPDPQTELNVIGTVSTGRNVARELGTIINISSNHDGSRVGGNVINGVKDYEVGADWLAQGNARVNANLTIELPQAYACDRFVIYNQNEYSNSRREVKRFTLEGSNDNSSWTTILDDEAGCSNAHEPNPGWSFRLPAGLQDDDEGVSYRYWRFTMKTFHGGVNSDPYGGIMELELYQSHNSAAGRSETTTHSLVASDVSAQTLRTCGQPSFLATASQNNVNIGSGGIFPFNTEQYDIGNNYNTSTYKFTAPVTGFYFFYYQVYRNSSTSAEVAIYVNNDAQRRNRCNPNGGDFIFAQSTILRLEVGNTVDLRSYNGNMDNFYGSSSNQRETHFGGYLLG